MEFLIRPVESQADLMNYYIASFPLFKEKFYSDSTDSDEDLFKAHCENLSDVDFFGSDATLLIAEKSNGEFAGAVWVGLRENNDMWDQKDELPAWVFDVEVLPKFRSRGLGRRLMLKAEEWTREMELDRIGLHTDYTLNVARNLYLSLGYKDFAYVLRKRVTESGSDFSKNYSPSRPRSEESMSPYFDWRVSRFRRVVGISDDMDLSTIESLYPKFKARPDIMSPSYTTYVVSDAEASLLGVVLGKMHDGDAWIVDLEVNPSADWESIAGPLLHQMEVWATGEKAPSIAVFINAKRTELIATLREINYEFTNFYMDKRLT